MYSVYTVWGPVSAGPAPREEMLVQSPGYCGPALHCHAAPPPAPPSDSQDSDSDRETATIPPSLAQFLKLETDTIETCSQAALSTVPCRPRPLTSPAHCQIGGVAHYCMAWYLNLTTDDQY